MLLTDIYYEATEMEANALRTSSWATPYDATKSGAARRGPRRIVGNALIGLGRLIAAEPAPAAQVRLGR